MPLENERPGMFAPRDQQLSRDSSANVPPLACGRPNKRQRPEREHFRQRRQGGLEQTQRAAVSDQSQYRAYAPGLSDNGQSQIFPSTAPQGVSTGENNRSSQCIDGGVYKGSVAFEYSGTSSQNLQRDDPSTDPRHTGHQQWPLIVPPSRLQPSRESTTQPPIVLSQHRRLSPPSSLHSRRSHHSKPLAHLLPMHETEPPGKITWYVTNPDPVPPDALPLCPIDYYTGRPEHRELHFGDEQPDMFPSEESYPTSAPFDAVEANSRVLNNRFYMESYGMIQLPKDLPSRDVAVDEEEEEYLRTLASAIPASVLHTKSTPEAAPTNLVDRSIQAHRPVATISDYYQATRAWKFEHEEGVANEALYPQKSALDYVQTQANSPAVTALDTDKGKYEAIVGSLVERRSSLEAIIGHFITENLERAVPTAAAILQHGVGSELAKHSHDKTTSNQRV